MTQQQTQERTPEQWAAATSDALSKNLAATMRRAVAAWQENTVAGRPDTAQVDLISAIAHQIAASNDIAAQIGDIAIMDLAELHTRARVEPLGLRAPDGDEARLIQALNLIFTGEPAQVLDRVERLAGAEPDGAAKKALQAAMKQRGITQWVRHVQPDACHPCAAKAGEARPIDVGFYDHPGCACTLRAVIPEGWDGAPPPARPASRMTITRTRSSR